MKRLALLLSLLAPQAVAVAETATDHAAIAESGTEAIVDGFAAFADRAATLHEAIRAACAEGAWSEAGARYREAYATWAAIDFIRFGPMEEHGTALSVNFWPDKKNFVGRALRSVRAAEPGDLADLDFLRGQSAAAQGFPALERLLFEGEAGDRCPLAVTISQHIDGQAKTLAADWRGGGGWAALMREPGPENPVYREGSEATTAFYNALDFGLEFLATQRLGRPLGKDGRARPKLTEARRSGQGLENARAQAAGLRRLSDAVVAPALAPLEAETLGALWDRLEEALAMIPAPLSEAVTTPDGLAAVERAAASAASLRNWLRLVAAPQLDIGITFNAADGD